MKKRVLYYLLPVLVLGCIGEKHFNPDAPRKIRHLKLVPPGTVWLRDSTFMDETEVRNIDYLEFLYWTYRLDRDNYQSILPDTMCWNLIEGIYKDYGRDYLRSSGFRNYPAVGISYTQAQAFCEWREDRINQFIYLQHHRVSKNIPPDSIYRIKAPQYIECRLPTREEWEYASSAGLEYPGFCYGYVRMLDAENKAVSNTYESVLLRQHTVTGFPSHIGHFLVTWNPTVPVKEGAPNKFGIYHLLGNVSEIIADSGFKGLNYTTTLDGKTMKEHPEDYERTDTSSLAYDYKFTFRYKKPTAWLGFRCVIVVKQIP